MKKYLSELKQFLKIGLPIYGSQASYTAMGLTDTIVAGRAGSTELSGVAIGASISNPFDWSHVNAKPMLRTEAQGPKF